ncbi:MAG: carboxylating nicotinate-nucleotide diphosphorylase [Mariprofundaceae bacterium]|nr:carboxylating nicotinate-nucleotide diphosphorylase [Mariprofundaceae bacterium]
MSYIDNLIELALLEDAAYEDLTANATILSLQRGIAQITAKATGTLSGCEIAQQVFDTLNPSIQQQWFKNDGDVVQVGDVIVELTGNLRALLAAERTALNFMQHLSGIATATQAFVDVVQGTDCLIADTRKTTPGLRLLEKKAVIHGGGINHRMDLSSGMLIKENHIEGSGSITDAIHACFEACFKNNYDVWVEVECETEDEVKEAVQSCPDIILLDNMTPEQVQRCRHLVPDSILLEASGNITLDNARLYAETGVNRIAIGAITHSSPSLDLSMHVQAIAMNVAANDES